jgi:hypothetical protein
MKNNLTAFSIFSLAVSIVIGSWLISNGMIPQSVEHTQEENTLNENEKKLLTQKELATYLGISIEEVIKLGPVGAGNGYTTSELPYIKIDKKIYFSKDAIDKWLTEGGVTHIDK